MTTLSEGDLQITVTGALCTRKFDGDGHGLSHCMNAVDFIVEFSDRYLFIELKDPQNPSSSEDPINYLNRFNNEGIDESLKRKYRDSFLYEWASGRADKPIDYFVLCALDSLDAALLTRRIDALKRKLPMNGPWDQPWSRPFVRSCMVFNIDSWNRLLPEYPVKRRGQAP